MWEGGRNYIFPLPSDPAIPPSDDFKTETTNPLPNHRTRSQIGPSMSANYQWTPEALDSQPQMTKLKAYEKQRRKRGYKWPGAALMLSFVATYQQLQLARHP